MEPRYLLVAIALVVAVYQSWVSVRLFNARQYDLTQRGLQLLLVWLLPGLGALVVHSFMKADGKARRPEPGYTEPSDNAS